VLWEVGPLINGFANLGATLGQAAIVRLSNGTWAAVVGNGVNSADGRAHLYFINLVNGALIADITAYNPSDAGKPNGMSSPLVIDKDNDGSADTVYVGDMLGNLWKFDIANNLTSRTENTPFFKAERNGTKQPIFARPDAMWNPEKDGTLLVFFGTGKFFEKEKTGFVGDLKDTSVQSFYGVMDDGDSATKTRSQLATQTIHTSPSGVGSYSAAGLRYVSNNTFSYDNKKGFMLDLVVSGQSAKGERVVNSPVLSNNWVLFSTLVPNPNDSDPCEVGSTEAWLYMVSLKGARPDTTFDLNGDSKFDANDQACNENGSECVPTTIVRIKNPGYTVTSGVDGHALGGSDEKPLDIELKKGAGRESWQQLR